MPTGVFGRIRPITRRWLSSPSSRVDLWCCRRSADGAKLLRGDLESPHALRAEPARQHFGQVAFQQDAAVDDRVEFETCVKGLHEMSNAFDPEAAAAIARPALPERPHAGKDLLNRSDRTGTFVHPPAGQGRRQNVDGSIESGRDAWLIASCLIPRKCRTTSPARQQPRAERASGQRKQNRAS